MSNEKQRFYGKVKFYIKEKGYGFLTTDDGEEVFFHVSKLKDPEEESKLKEGCALGFEMADSKKGKCAIDISVVE